MGYQQYGISPRLVERIKLKLKNPATKERVKELVDGITKQDLQNGPKVQRLVKSTAKLLNEKFTPAEEEQIIRFVLSQRIDPNNTFHLIKLWGMFR
ncbi:stage VI sporulation protein F [Paenibacillus crassostreae]|uniref:Serine/threonine protein kinase n=1 Tax=Paenibacillus crassostreae TaxID=1763538 RepID=A0A162KUW5_9BACL|nr:stage VI sporulation protein F [Paenibacillus crassostreae]AOZ91518.1 serine/threonine protein kinase [Paenibacillus crassostreae]OAB74323.1 serine/threonine protein kinase [Paenibacillus crassostreae]